MKEPTVGFFGGSDFDDRAVVPVGRAEVAEVLDASFDLVEYLAVPATSGAAAADAIVRVSTVAVDFPRHLDVVAQFVDVEIAGTFGLGFYKVVDFAFFAGAGFEDGL